MLLVPFPRGDLSRLFREVRVRSYIAPLTAATITAMLSSTLPINTGIEIRVGMAARFTTRGVPIEAAVKKIRMGLAPVSITVISVTGVTRQPCIPSATPSQSRRFSCWPLHQFIKRVDKAIFEAWLPRLAAA